MKNYLMLNNRKIELTAEQVKEIENSFGLGRLKLSDIAIGDTFKIDKYEFIVLNHHNENTTVILKDLLYESKKFGTTNNYENSYVDDLCNKFGGEIAEIIGEENLVEHSVDLTSDDGLKDYGNIKRKMSLLTTNLYRRYIEILDKHKTNKWWWLATAYSTPTHEHSSWVKCVAPSGIIGNDNCDYDRNGVRPFCILKSNIFVSK